MKTILPVVGRLPFILALIVSGTYTQLHAQEIPPLDSHEWLNYWSFSDTNQWRSDLDRAPMGFANLAVSDFGNFSALVLDSTEPAWVQYKINEFPGANNLTVNEGSVLFWFAPNWAGTNQAGAGPGDWARLIEIGAYTTNASYGWWSLYLDPEGANLYFAAQTNGATQIYLSAPIAWTTNRWHFIALTYSGSNSALYLDGELATNGLPVVYWPGADVLTNGFWIGSDSSGLSQAHGMFDDLFTYDFAVDEKLVDDLYRFFSMYYFLNPLNPANLSHAPFTPSHIPALNGITGSGYLTPVKTNTLNCVSSGEVWITNVVVAPESTNMSLTFEVAGGAGGLFYDVFANSILPATIATNTAWTWMGQGGHCVSYSMTNLPSTTCFLVLGTPQDSDSDGLTDAYENLVSRTDPFTPDSDGDGISDLDEVLGYTNPLVSSPAIPPGFSPQICPQ